MYFRLGASALPLNLLGMINKGVSLINHKGTKGKIDKYKKNNKFQLKNRIYSCLKNELTEDEKSCLRDVEERKKLIDAFKEISPKLQSEEEIVAAITEYKTFHEE